MNDQDLILELVNKALQNPETRKELLKVAKKVQPDLAIPELDVSEETQKLYDEINTLKEELKREKLMADMEKRRQKIKERGYDPDQVEQLMLDKGIADENAAIEYLELQKKTAAPHSLVPHLDENVREINLTEMPKDVDKWAREQALKLIREGG